MAASQGQWSAFWGDPMTGTVQMAEEEEVGHDGADLQVAVKAVLEAEVGTAQPSALFAHGDAAVVRPASPTDSDPLPPPERA